MDEFTNKISIGRTLLEVFELLKYIREHSGDGTIGKVQFNTIESAKQFANYYRIIDKVKVHKNLKMEELKLENQAQLVLYTIYEKFGLKSAYECFDKAVDLPKEEIDYKSLLQEYVQQQKQQSVYEIISQEGPPNETIFTAQVSALGRTAIGKGSSKKQAQKDAAYQYYQKYPFTVKKKKKLMSSLFEKWNIRDSRMDVVKKIAKEFQIPDSLISSHLMDTALTHISYRNDNQKYFQADNEELTVLGSFYLRFVMQHYLLKSKIESDHFDLIQKSGLIIQKDSFYDLFTAKKKESIEKSILASKGLDVKNALIFNKVIKSILAGLVLHNMMKGFVYDDVLERFTDQFIRRLPIQLENVKNYVDWLTVITETLSLDKRMEYNQIGTDHEKKFQTILKISGISSNFPNEWQVTASSKQEARKMLSEMVYKDWKALFIQPNWLMVEDPEFLRQLLSLAITTKETSIHKLHAELLGGLCLENWQTKEAKLLVETLRMLYFEEETTNLIKIWDAKYGREVILSLQLEKEFLNKIFPTNRIVLPQIDLSKIEDIIAFGEQYCVEYEKEILNSINPELSKQVKYVSIDQPLCGYDIESVTPSGEKIYIEVKTATTNKAPFYLTRKSWKKAQELGDQYYVYRLELTETPKLYCIQNIYKKIEQGDILFEETLYSVEQW